MGGSFAEVDGKEILEPEPHPDEDQCPVGAPEDNNDAEDTGLPLDADGAPPMMQQDDLDSSS